MEDYYLSVRCVLTAHLQQCSCLSQLQGPLYSLQDIKCDAAPPAIGKVGLLPVAAVIWRNKRHCTLLCTCQTCHKSPPLLLVTTLWYRTQLLHQNDDEFQLHMILWCCLKGTMPLGNVDHVLPAQDYRQVEDQQVN